MIQIATINIEYKKEANETERKQALDDLLETLNITVDDMINNYHVYPLIAYGIKKITIENK